MADYLREGFTAVTPHLVIRGCAEALELYKRAFGAEEAFCMPSPDGGKLMHAEITIDGARIMLADEVPEMGSQSPQGLGGTPVAIHLSVPDVDAAVARASAAGCEVTMPPADVFWGDRYARLRDPFGHVWALAQRIADPTPEEIEAGMTAAMAEGGDGS